MPDMWRNRDEISRPGLGPAGTCAGRRCRIPGAEEASGEPYLAWATGRHPALRLPTAELGAHQDGALEPRGPAHHYSARLRRWLGTQPLPGEGAVARLAHPVTHLRLTRGVFCQCMIWRCTRRSVAD